MIPVGTIGSVSALWCFPVKSMLGVRTRTAVVTRHGLLGDRAYAVIDVETDQVASAKDVRSFSSLFRFKAAYVEPPRPDQALPAVRIELPGGETVRSDSDEVDRVLSSHLQRQVKLVQSPDDSPDPFHDAAEVSVLTLSTLRTLGDRQPASHFDERRFRMNVIVESPESGFPENDWLGRELSIGHSVRLRVEKPNARCVMTTLAQEELSRDPGILKALARHNRRQVGGQGPYPCAGVYARVLDEGEVKQSDPVEVMTTR